MRRMSGKFAVVVARDGVEAEVSYSEDAAAAKRVAAALKADGQDAWARRATSRKSGGIGSQGGSNR